MTFTKKDLIDGVAVNLNTTKAVATDLVNSVFEGITQALDSHETVEINGFGKFTVETRAARTGRNPATGEELQIKAKNVVKFKPSKALKDVVED